MGDDRTEIDGSSCMDARGGRRRRKTTGPRAEYTPIRGVARALLDHATSPAVERRCETVRLATIRETGNVPIFERLAFTIVAEFPSELCEGPAGEAVTEVELERAATTSKRRSR